VWTEESWRAISGAPGRVILGTGAALARLNAQVVTHKFAIVTHSHLGHSPVRRTMRPYLLPP